jgi:hypothetical protein
VKSGYRGELAMSDTRIHSAFDIYDLVHRIAANCEDPIDHDLRTRLDAALQLGSSGLEINGAIRLLLVENHDRVVELLGDGSQNEIDEVIRFFDRAYGRSVFSGEGRVDA